MLSHVRWWRDDATRYIPRGAQHTATEMADVAATVAQEHALAPLYAALTEQDIAERRAAWGRRPTVADAIRDVERAMRPERINRSKP